MKVPVRVPQILSAEEAERLLLMAGRLQVRMLFSIGYGAGLRVSEVVKLKVKHVDSGLGVLGRRLVGVRGTVTATASEKPAPKPT